MYVEYYSTFFHFLILIFYFEIAQLSSLIGKTAPPEFLQIIILLARNHHKDIIAIDSVKAYLCGYKYVVELNIILDSDMRLKKTYDIGKTLKNKLELLDNVERAFVHIKY